MYKGIQNTDILDSEWFIYITPYIGSLSYLEVKIEGVLTASLLAAM